MNVFFPEIFSFWGLFDGGLKGAGGLSSPFIGVIMIGVMLFSIFVGFPISFTLIFLAFVFGAWGFGGKLVFYLQTLQFNNVMLEQTLAAVPLFVLMGILMEKAGLMERLFTSVQLMLSRTRGALYLAVLFVSTIFAAATGIVGASVTILGIMAAKTMNRSGYDVRLAAGTITAGGTLGILIPPSIMLVVMGPVLQVPVTDLFAAAIIPGILLASMYAAYALIRCWLNPSLGPILPPEQQPITSDYYWLEAILVIGSIITFFVLIVMAFSGSLAGYFAFSSLLIPLGWMAMMFFGSRWIRDNKPAGFFFSDLWYEFFMGLVPPTVLIAFSLGSIVAGLATPAEAAACGAFGSLILSIGYKKFSIVGAYDALINNEGIHSSNATKTIESNYEDGLTDVKEAELESDNNELTPFYLQDAYELGVESARFEGRTDVTNNPNAFSLVSNAQYNLVVTQRDARPTRDAYDTVVEERDARPTLGEVKDARLGSVVLQPDNGNNSVKIRFSIEETDDLKVWTKRDEINEVTVPLELGSKFYRFALQDE